MREYIYLMVTLNIIFLTTQESKFFYFINHTTHKHNLFYFIYKLNDLPGFFKFSVIFCKISKKLNFLKKAKMKFQKIDSFNFTSVWPISIN